MMALKLTFPTVYGFDAVSAYHRVENIRIHNKTEITFDLRAYIGEGNFAALRNVSLSCPYDIEGENPIKQAYVFLKLQPEFADAEDC